MTLRLNQSAELTIVDIMCIYIYLSSFMHRNSFQYIIITIKISSYYT